MTNEEFEQEIKRLEEKIEDQINSLIIKFLESEENKKLYEVKVPEDIESYYYVDELGDINLVGDTFHETDYEGVYLRGLAFKTREEAEQFDKERTLINRAKDWAKKYNEGWTPNWNESGSKYSIEYDNSLECLEFDSYYVLNLFSKLPYFKTEEIAEQFIEEFGEDIKEVLC